MKPNNLIDEFFYSDTNFVLREGELTEAERQAYVRQSAISLRRSRTQSKAECHELADRLDDCRPHHRCLSAGCLMCATAHQRRSMAQLRTLWSEGTKLKTMTLVIPGLHRPLDELDTVQLASVYRHIRRKFETAGCGDIPIAGYIDISHNQHAQGAYEDHWAPHLPFLTLAEFADEVKRKLGDVLAITESVKRPGRCDPIKDWDWQTSYINKPRPVRRIDFDHYSPKAQPSKRWLKPQQLVEFLLWASFFHPSDRQFMMNIRQYGDALRLLPSARKPTSISVSSSESSQLAWKGSSGAKEARKSRNKQLGNGNTAIV